MQSALQPIGRYAPSPTGPLHLGNLRTALIAWLHARLQGGQFLIRMEDLDTHRVIDGSAQQILRDLEWLGLDWDGEVVYQSQRTELYQGALEKLRSQSLIYPCFCSRKDILQAVSAPHNHTEIYPGTCARLSPSEIDKKCLHKAPSYRLRADQTLSCGDFVVKRSDKLFAYQLAVVVDDLDQGVTEVVRGSDLEDSTARQLYLAKMLGSTEPVIAYYHAPLMRDDKGKKMSKRDGALSSEAYRQQGYSAQQLVTELAVGLGLINNSTTLSAVDLMTEIQLCDLQLTKHAGN